MPVVGAHSCGRSIHPTSRIAAFGKGSRAVSPRAAQSKRILDGKKWDWLGLFQRVPVPFPSIWQRNPGGIGGAVGARRKLLIYWFLCRQIRLIPAPLEPRESGYRTALGVSPNRSRCPTFQRRRLARLVGTGDPNGALAWPASQDSQTRYDRPAARRPANGAAACSR
jgi:hypothetical protein